MAVKGVVGIKQILACDVGTLSGGSPTGAVAIGFGKGKQLKISDHKTEKAWPNITMHNMKNFALEGESFQPTLFAVKKSLDFLNGGCDVQMVTPNQTMSSGSDDVAKFIGNYLMGLMFEWTIAHDKRTLKWMFERAMEYENYQTFIDTWDSETAVSVTGVTDVDIEGKNYLYRRSPKYLAIESPVGDSLSLSNYERIERKVVLKSKETQKNDLNQSIVDLATISIELVGRGKQVADLVTLAGKAETPSVLIKEGNAGSLFDAISIPAFKVGIGDEFTIGDDKRESRIKLEGDIPITDISFLYGTDNGGGSTDTTGLTGGTIKLG